MDNVEGRIPGWYLLEEAGRMLREMEVDHQIRIDSGDVDPHSVLDKPVVERSWLRRWRAFYHVTTARRT